ncbi:FaeA/PapI family transcriptional regulator [Serratia bockelmannii]|uniref:FaeA/PapI family transcriptional regulator n=1 Tax=Serratia bockelmannii TaxID=2703793 RepID=UPI003B598206
MTVLTPPERTSRYPLYQEVLITLLALTGRRVNGQVPPPQDTWATTRQISDTLDISIYQARLLLLDLVKYGLVLVSDRRFNKSLRWYPHISACNLYFQPQQGTLWD